MKHSILFLLIFCVCTSGSAQNPVETKLLPNDGSAGDIFGFAVAISGETALVGANEKDDFKGAAYFFHKSESGWQQQSKWVPDDVAPAAYFGFSVALEDDIAVVGARNDDDNGVNAGAIYIYERANGEWQQTAKIISDDGRSLDFFGNAVAISGETIIVSAIGADVYRGAAYIVGRDGDAGGWQLQAKLVADDRAASDVFGSSAAIAGDFALIGASSDDDRGFQSGAAYIFQHENGEWRQKAKLVPQDGAQDDLFGVAVDLAETHAIIGAIGNDEKSPGAGAAYLYKHDAQTSSGSH